ncbi:MAG: hypothetical protein ACE5FK_08880 [Candidatus Methylomirabilia bacterium]
MILHYDRTGLREVSSARPPWRALSLLKIVFDDGDTPFGNGT